MLQRSRLSDSRGHFQRLYCAESLTQLGFKQGVAQINHSHTLLQGTVRGLHFQIPPEAEQKIVTCVRGRVFDVAVDLRVGSPSYLAWHAEILDAENALSMLIPEGFAHGFQSLVDDCELVYVHSTAYAASFERGLNASDPTVAIGWPLPFSCQSERDRSLPRWTPAFHGVEIEA